MKKISKTVVFFGSGPVAARSLELLTNDFEIEAVVTKPRAPHHRGEVPVLELCEKLGLKTFTPTNKTELSELFASKPVKSEVGVVIDYGIIINQDVIDYFPYGIVNSHFSLLPEWRGADPITFAILSGQAQTGVSLMLIVAEMDKGPLLATAPFSLPPDITTPELTDQLIEISHQMLATTLPLYLNGEIIPVPQDTAIAPTYSRKLTKEDGMIDWNKPAEQIEREIRAFIEWPKSRTKLGHVEVIITRAHAVPSDGIPGTLEIAKEANALIVYCGSGYLRIERVKPAGKKEMSTAEFIRGYRDKLIVE